MALRRPASHLRRATDRRRSGDEIYWESLMSEDGFSPGVSHPLRAPRPQSAIEGGQLDKWLEHLRATQTNSSVPVHNPSFYDRTTFVPIFDKAPARCAERQTGTPSFSRDSSSCGSSSLCESSLGSQESLQTGLLSFSERRGSCERAHIMQAPRKEQTQFSYLAPVKIGWLPIQRRVMRVEDACDQSQFLDHSSGHLKMRQPITPTFQKNQATTCGEGEEDHSSRRALSVKTWQTPDQGSPVLKQVPEKLSFAADEGDRPFGCQVRRRGWNRVSAFPGGNKLNDHPTGTNSVANRESPLIDSTSAEPRKHFPLHRTTSADPCGHHTRPRQTNTTDAVKRHTPLHRTNSLQPMKATEPLCGINNSSQLSLIQTNSAEKTLIPQNKAGISSITISSRKVSRSASLPGSKTCHSSSQSSESPSPPLEHQPMEPHSRQVTVHRKATIVKVTEKRVISSPGPSTRRERTPPVSYGLDTVVHRRKATIIKVTEHKESCSPAKLGSRYPEHRHSYSEGVLKDNVVPPHQLLSTMPASTTVPNTFSSNSETPGNLHRSTLNLFVGNRPMIAPLTSSEVSPRAVGQRVDRPHRPVSCYGNLTGHTEPSMQNVTQAATRKWSFGLPCDTYFNPANSDSSFISPGKAVQEAGQRVADTLKPNADEKERLPPSVNGIRRASPSLTLIKAPDPHSHQSQEEVLALNAAAIIANIKLQRQLSKKKTASGDSEKDCTASPEANTVTNKRKWGNTKSEQSGDHKQQPHAAFVPLKLDNERSTEAVSLQQALQRFRPDFISRSQSRVRDLEQKAQERRQRSSARDRQAGAALRQRSAHSARSPPVNGNFLKARGRTLPQEHTQPIYKNTFPEVRRKKDEEKKREVCLSNRQRVELFKQKLLAQILQRNNK